MPFTRLFGFSTIAMTMFPRGAPDGMASITALILACVLISVSLGCEAAAETRKFRFAYDQPRDTGYSVAADVFASKIVELSKGAFVIEQYPGAQLGQEPQVLQLLKSGDLDFAITSSANTATLSPQAGVFSLHFLFRSEDHLTKALGDERVSTAVRHMIDDTVQGVHVLALGTLGFRNMYGKKEIHKLEDIKGLKVRVQATATEDTMFPAYAAQTVHMPFGSVYTSLQTGVVAIAENGINVYLVNKHYEVAPVLSLTEHEANNSLVWVSDKLWQSLTGEQRTWVQAAADEVARVEPGKALELEKQSQTKLVSMGVKVVTDVDKTGFVKIAEPYLDKLAKELGPHSEKIVRLVRSVQ
jgi:tripartite ATP-independent transporter DctP family solute receptor